MGRFKAMFFAAFGFSGEDWEDFESELRRIVLLEKAEMGERTDYGQKFLVRGTLSGPTGGSAGVVTVWIVLNGEAAPRLVTVYPE